MWLLLQALNTIEYTLNEVKKGCTKKPNCGDYWNKTCCDVVRMGTKHYVAIVTSIEYHRIDFEWGTKVLYQGSQLWWL